MQGESAKYRAVLNTFWSNMDVIEWAPDEKLFYLWAFTNSYLDTCGCYQVSTKVIAHEMGVGHDRVCELITLFSDRQKILYDFDSKELLLLNWKKHNEGLFKEENKNSRKAIEKGASKIKSERFKQVMLIWLGGSEAPTLAPCQAPTLTPTPQPKPKPEPEPKEEPKDNDASSQASTTPLPPATESEPSSSLKVSINEFRVLFQEATGSQMPGGCNQQASELCRLYAREKIKDAFEITAVQGGKTFKYVASVLEGRPKPEPRGRDRPGRQAEAVERGKANVRQAMEAIYAAEGV